MDKRLITTGIALALAAGGSGLLPPGTEENLREPLTPIDDSLKYQSKLRQMAQRQVLELQAGDTTYASGVDFMTNQPQYRLMQGRTLDDRSLGIKLDLSAALKESDLYSS